MVVETVRRLPPPRGAAADPVTPNATLVERDDLTGSIVRLRLRPDDGVPAFRPGQYLALGLPTDGRLVQRPYSTASAAGESDALEFLVRLVSGGMLTPRLWQLASGARAHVGRPKGRFVPDAADPRRPLYIATGTGIAPLMAMLETRLRERFDEPSRLPIVIHGVARTDELAYRDRLAALAAGRRIAYLPVISRPAEPVNAGWRGATGRIDARLPQVLAAAATDPHASIAYVCGNPGMVDAVRDVLGAASFPAEAVRFEAYWTTRAA